MDSLTVTKLVTGLRFLTLAVVISFSGELTISLQSAVVSHPAGIRHFWNLRQSRASEQGNGRQNGEPDDEDVSFVSYYSSPRSLLTLHLLLSSSGLFLADWQRACLLGLVNLAWRVACGTT
jgi:hypothetical protein